MGSKPHFNPNYTPFYTPLRTKAKGVYEAVLIKSTGMKGYVGIVESSGNNQFYHGTILTHKPIEKSKGISLLKEDGRKQHFLANF